MYCPNCGKKIDDIENSKFCPNCGKDLKSEAVKKTGKVEKKQTANPKRASAMVFVALLAVVLCFFVIVVMVSSMNSTIHITDEKEKEEMFQKMIDEQKGTPSTPATVEPQQAPSEPTTNTNEIDPDFYEEGFFIDDLRDICNANVFSFVDKWKGKRILVEGYIKNMDSTFASLGRCINLCTYDIEAAEFDYQFYIACYLEGDGGEMTQWIDGNNYCMITGELDADHCSSDRIVLEHCYVYSVE